MTLTAFSVAGWRAERASPDGGSCGVSGALARSLRRRSGRCRGCPGPGSHQAAHAVTGTVC
jgi:hypothetical protein